MIRRAVVVAPDAQRDLLSLYDHIADAASPAVAATYLRRVQTHLAGFDLAAERGSLRSDLRPGLRTIGFERRLTIAFSVSEDQVTILRVFNGGRDWSENEL